MGRKNRERKRLLTREHRIIISNATPKLEQVTLGICSDTHFGSKTARIDLFQDYVKEAKRQGVKTFLHAGDLTDGMGVYRGQEVEQNAIGLEDQIELATESIPFEKCVIWYMIGGNHDYSFTKRAGADVIKAVQAERSDIRYLGNPAGEVTIKGVTIRLVHGSGGGAYAASYPIQKYVRNHAESGLEIMPSSLIIGHHHRNLYMQTMGIHCILPGNFQGPTEYTIRRGLTGRMGGYVLHMTIKDGKIRQFNPTWIGQ